MPSHMFGTSVKKDKLLKRADSQSLNVSEVSHVSGDYMEQ